MAKGPIEMRAIIDCTGYNESLKPINDYRPTPLINIVGKPCLFYVFDALTRLGVKKVELILCHLPKMIEERVFEGERWGLEIDYYLAQNPNRPFSIVSGTAKGWPEECLIIGRGDELPSFEFTKNQLQLFDYANGSWSGWGSIPTGLISNLQGDENFWDIFSLFRGDKKKCDPFIKMSNFSELRDTNIKLINEGHGDTLFPTSARMVEPDIWISRGVVIHPGTKIVGPAFIGESVNLSEKTVIGPQVVIEDNCFIDKGSKIKGSVIAQNSYVGESLAIENAYVDRNLLVDLKNETQIKITDNFILSELHESKKDNFLYCLFEKAFALFLIILFSPLKLFLNADFEEDDVVLLPYQGKFEMIRWKQYRGSGIYRFFRHLPILNEVVKGNIHFVGSSPRNLKQIEEMPPDWRSLYLTSRLGLITLADLDKGETEDERYASDAYYAVHRNFLFDVRCFFRWLKQKIGL